MSRFQFELADERDDEQLRGIHTATPLPGRISLSFEREPSFFGAASIEGDNLQVIACRDKWTGRIVGLGTRSVRDRFVQGSIERVAYLGSLRLLPRFRSAGLLARGYRFLKEIAEQEPATFQFTSITDDNTRAVRVLTSGRAGLPCYQRIATLRTYALTRKDIRRDSNQSPRWHSRRAQASELADVLRFLNRRAVHRDFCFHYQPADFGFHPREPDYQSSAPVSWEEDTACRIAADQRVLSPTQVKLDPGCANGVADEALEDVRQQPSTTFRDLPVERIHLAENKGEIVGTLAAWDQSRFKQVVVHSLPCSWRLLRPGWNAYAFVTGQARLLRPGERLNCVSAAAMSIAESHEESFVPLLHTVMQGFDRNTYLLVAVDSRDPLQRHLAKLTKTFYQTGIYLVGWDTTQLSRFQGLNPISLELGCL